MADIDIWHNPRCSKSRQTLTLIKNSGKTVNIRNYLQSPPTVEELKFALEKLNMTARQVLRKGESEYRDLGLEDTSLSEQDLLTAIHNNPILIERPVVFAGDRAVLGRPPENVLELLQT
jgi:arsenate reductase (glutaredoxin)